MGIISIEKSNHLYWLGRYTERAFTTISTFMEAYDRMIDADPDAYKAVCEKLNIPDIYGSKEVFIVKYLFDRDDPNSIISNLVRAYDNAMVMRDILTSEALSYIHMAMSSMEEAKETPHCLLNLMDVIDNMYSFWGCVDDKVESSSSRNILKLGRYVERLDLCIRLDYDRNDVESAYEHMVYRLERSKLTYDEQNLQIVTNAMSYDDDLRKVLYNINNIFKD